MEIHKDVYDLLRLYDGLNPRAAFKPHLQPDDWREREQAQLHFRSQVPDSLEAAYDIALGEGLLKQHLLKPEDHARYHKTFGLPVPKRYLEGSVVPANADAWIVMTDKGRAAVASYRTQPTEDKETAPPPPPPPPPPPRLTVDLAKKQATLDGKSFDVSSENALRWIKVLAEHPGAWICGSELAKFDELLIGVRTDRLKTPSAISDLIDCKPGTGSRIRL